MRHTNTTKYKNTTTRGKESTAQHSTHYQITFTFVQFFGDAANFPWHNLYTYIISQMHCFSTKKRIYDHKITVNMYNAMFVLWSYRHATIVINTHHDTHIYIECVPRAISVNITDKMKYTRDERTAQSKQGWREREREKKVKKARAHHNSIKETQIGARMLRVTHIMCDLSSKYFLGAHSFSYLFAS